MLRISELFVSIQGEGQYAGTPSVFVRTTGCNLRCWYCDTPFTSWSPAGQQQSWQQVLEQALAHPESHVVLTGGEPLLQPDIVPLSAALRDAGRFVTVETAGTVYRPVQADLMSISPKLSNSLPTAPTRWRERHARVQADEQAVRQLIQQDNYQLKFVVDQPADLAEIESYLERFPEIRRETVWLMPQGITSGDLAARTQWLAPWASARGYSISPRRHIDLYGHRRGT